MQTTQLIAKTLTADKKRYLEGSFFFLCPGVAELTGRGGGG